MTAQLGLRANLAQFSLLVGLNAFVGAMVGLERTVLPLLGEHDFGLTSKTAITSFIVSFGVTKALLNLVAARLSDRVGRKPILIVGWLFALPVPFLIIFAPAWWWVDLANVLLGANQAMAWSMTVIMKVDLVGPRRRGLALGLNEFAGYVAVGLMSWITGFIAGQWGLRPYPFYLGIGIAVVGLVVSVLAVRETRGHVALEASAGPVAAASRMPRLGHIFYVTSVGNISLFAACQAGLVNNLNDGMSWGLFPLFFAAHGLPVEHIGVVKAVYPLTWGLLQVATGPLSDRIGRRGLIAGGMIVQAVGIWLTVVVPEYSAWLVGAVLQGAGTAMVYPTLLAAIADHAHPSWRASSLGVYRFWRDLGYAIGALVSGLIADALGLDVAIHVVAALTLLSGGLVALIMRQPAQISPVMAARSSRGKGTDREGGSYGRHRAWSGPRAARANHGDDGRIARGVRSRACDAVLSMGARRGRTPGRSLRMTSTTRRSTPDRCSKGAMNRGSRRRPCNASSRSGLPSAPASSARSSG